MTHEDLKKLADTPRTDAEAYDTGLRLTDGDKEPDLVVRASFAKKLERECAALQQEVEAYKRAKQENDDRFMLERDEARQEVKTLRATVKQMQRAGLAELFFQKRTRKKVMSCSCPYKEQAEASGKNCICHYCIQDRLNDEPNNGGT